MATRLIFPGFMGIGRSRSLNIECLIAKPHGATNVNPDADFLTRRITEQAVSFIERNKAERFFLYITRPLHFRQRASEEQKNVIQSHPAVVQSPRRHLQAFAKDIAENSRPAAFVGDPKPLSKQNWQERLCRRATPHLTFF